jgi:formate-dependent nitrite reductase membrane component NrfD
MSAVDGANGTEGTTRRRRRGRRGEQLMVPDADFSSYYGRPILKEMTWEATDIAGYLFLGGLAGASSVLAAGAQATGRPQLERAAKFAALGGISLSLAALVHDLGRPGRFVNMLRVFKPTSPMSVGSWLLAGYSPLAGAAAVANATGLLPGLGAAATAGAGLLGPAVASYTSVLICDTAVPAWHDGFREMPFVFTGSAACAAGGLGMLAAPVEQAAPARRLAVIGAATELAALERMRPRLGPAAETHDAGSAGRLLRAARILTVAGATGGMLLGRRSRTASVLSGAALLAGSACTRFGLFEAGRASVQDPKYVVNAQNSSASGGASSAGAPS